MIREAGDMSHHQYSNLGRTLDYILSMQDKIKIISKMAFRAIDKDGSGSIERSELEEVLRTVANTMGIPQPTENDLDALLYEMDQNNDDNVDEEEFEFLIIKVLENMQHAEMEQMNTLKNELPAIPQRLPMSQVSEDAAIEESN